MSSNKQDKRIQHTKFFLKNALLNLMNKKNINQITTTELCKEANINRNTFYSHYATPEDVLNEIENELMIEIENILMNPSDQEKLLSLYQHFKNKKDIYKTFIISNNHQMSKKILKCCEENNIFKWKDLDIPNPKLSSMYYQFTSSGSMSLIHNWIMNDCSMPIKELSDIIETLSLNGLNEFKKLNY